MSWDWRRRRGNEHRKARARDSGEPSEGAKQSRRPMCVDPTFPSASAAGDTRCGRTGATRAPATRSRSRAKLASSSCACSITRRCAAIDNDRILEMARASAGNTARRGSVPSPSTASRCPRLRSVDAAARPAQTRRNTRSPASSSSSVWWTGGLADHPSKNPRVRAGVLVIRTREVRRNQTEKVDACRRQQLVPRFIAA